MRVTYRIHPGEYAIGENEKLYTDQAAKGWLLEKRGAYMSKFRKGAPARLRYRIELTASPPAFAMEEDLALPEAQVALYEDCGWTLAARRGLVHVFCAPEDSPAPEFYSEPEQQACTLKALRRSYRLSMILVALMLAVMVGAACLAGGSPAQTALDFGADFGMKLIRSTAWSLFYPLWLGWLIYQLFYGGVRTWLLYRRLKQGRPLDHAPRTRHWVHRLVTAFFAAGVGLSLVLTVVQLAGVKSYEMPPEADGPYVTLAELGITGERTEGYYGDGSTVETMCSLAAQMWRTSEFAAAGGNTVHLNQNVYRFSNPALAQAAVPCVMGSAIFGSPESFVPAQAPGLDGAWCSGLEYVAVKDEWVVDLVLIGAEAENGAVFDALAGRLG